MVYLFLIGLQLFNNVASILLYALLCCIYAALLGTVVYFFPRLVLLMRPILEDHPGLAVRLLVSTFVCLVVFGAQTIDYAKIVVAPPKTVYWWWNYGALELVPSAVLLILTHPFTKTSSRGSRPPDDSAAATAPPVRRSSNVALKRTDSGMAVSGRRNNTSHENVTLLTKGGGASSSTTNYGAVSSNRGGVSNNV